MTNEERIKEIEDRYLTRHWFYAEEMSAISGILPQPDVEPLELVLPGGTLEHAMKSVYFLLDEIKRLREDKSK